MNLNHDGVLSLDEILSFCYKLNIYVTEHEASKILNRMDVDKDDRVEENDFIQFIQRTDFSIIQSECIGSSRLDSVVYKTNVHHVSIS